jgi:hypothetical protein
VGGNYVANLSPDRGTLPVPTLKVWQSDKPNAMGTYDFIKAAQKLAVIKAYREGRGYYTLAAEPLILCSNHLHRLIRILNLKLDLLRNCSEVTV